MTFTHDLFTRLFHHTTKRESIRLSDASALNGHADFGVRDLQHNASGIIPR